MTSPIVKVDVNSSHDFLSLSLHNNSSNNSNDDPSVPSLYPFYTRLIVTLVGAVILIIGISGNVLVPTVVWSNRYMRSSTNLLLVNLSVADLLVLVLCIPTVLIEVHTKPETWMLGEVMCKLIPFVEFTVAHVSVLTILAISFERYYAVCYPFEAGYTCTKSRAGAIIVSAWVLSAVLTSPVLLITEFWYTEYMDNSLVPVCTMQVHTLWRKLYFVFTIAIFFVVPLIMLITIYVIVCRNLTEDKLFCGKNRNCGDNADSTSVKCRKQVISMLIAVVVCFFVCLFPLRAFHLWIILSPMNNIMSLGSTLYYAILFGCRTFTYLNSAINPIIYNAISSKFRDAFCKHLGLKNYRRQRRFFRSRSCQLRKTISSTNSTNMTVSTLIYDVPPVNYSSTFFRSKKDRVSPKPSSCTKNDK